MDIDEDSDQTSKTSSSAVYISARGGLKEVIVHYALSTKISHSGMGFQWRLLRICTKYQNLAFWYGLFKRDCCTYALSTEISHSGMLRICTKYQNLAFWYGLSKEIVAHMHQVPKSRILVCCVYALSTKISHSGMLRICTKYQNLAFWNGRLKEIVAHMH